MRRRAETKARSRSSRQFRIIRGRLGSLVLYEMTEDELQLVEQGSPNSIFLNFAIFFLSVAVSLLITLTTVDITSLHLLVTFMLATTVGLAGGSLLLVLWYRGRTPVNDVVRRIKARVDKTSSGA